MTCGRAAHEPSVRTGKYLKYVTKVTSGGNTGPEHVRGLNFLYFLDCYLIRKFKNLNRVCSGLLSQYSIITAVKLLEALISFSFGSVFFFFVTQSKEKENEH